jgi:hypothetical protein
VKSYEKAGREEEKEDKDNEMITFIDVLIDLFPFNQYRDCVNEKKRALF